MLTRLCRSWSYSAELEWKRSGRLKIDQIDEDRWTLRDLGKFFDWKDRHSCSKVWGFEHCCGQGERRRLLVYVLLGLNRRNIIHFQTQISCSISRSNPKLSRNNWIKLHNNLNWYWFNYSGFLKKTPCKKVRRIISNYWLFNYSRTPSKLSLILWDIIGH